MTYDALSTNVDMYGAQRYAVALTLDEWGSVQALFSLGIYRMPPEVWREISPISTEIMNQIDKQIKEEEKE